SINRWPVFLLQNGFRFRPEDPAWHAADDPALWESLRVARDLLYNQKRPMSLWTENNSDAEQLFLEGKASMIMTTYYGMNRFLHSGIDYGAAPLPSLNHASTLLTATGLSVVRGTQREELARQFIEHLVSYDSQALIKRSAVTLPAHADALAITEGLTGNRPAGERIYEELWDLCDHYAD
ncbi:extracellular solute-binding protein, partial [Mycobacterium tuberculosis]